jgi:hypothetical protein
MVFSFKPSAFYPKPQASCVQLLDYIGSILLRVGFASSFGALRKVFGRSSGVLRENSLKYPRNTEGFPKNLYKRLKMK